MSCWGGGGAMGSKFKGGGMHFKVERFSRVYVIEG